MDYGPFESLGHEGYSDKVAAEKREETLDRAAARVMENVGDYFRNASNRADFNQRWDFAQKDVRHFVGIEAATTDETMAEVRKRVASLTFSGRKQASTISWSEDTENPGEFIGTFDSAEGKQYVIVYNGNGYELILEGSDAMDDKTIGTYDTVDAAKQAAEGAVTARRRSATRHHPDRLKQAAQWENADHGAQRIEFPPGYWYRVQETIRGDFEVTYNDTDGTPWTMGPYSTMDEAKAEAIADAKSRGVYREARRKRASGSITWSPATIDGISGELGKTTTVGASQYFVIPTRLVNHPNYNPANPWYDLYVFRPSDYRDKFVYLTEGLGSADEAKAWAEDDARQAAPNPGSQNAEPNGITLHSSRRTARRKQAWSLGADGMTYTSDVAQDGFDCPSCGTGNKLGFSRCSCGKQWNSYTIKTPNGGQKMLAREVEARPEAILANRRRQARRKRANAEEQVKALGLKSASFQWDQDGHNPNGVSVGVFDDGWEFELENIGPAEYEYRLYRPDVDGAVSAAYGFTDEQSAIAEAERQHTFHTTGVDPHGRGGLPVRNDITVLTSLDKKADREFIAGWKTAERDRPLRRGVSSETVAGYRAYRKAHATRR